MKHPNEHFESEAEYVNGLKETQQQLDPEVATLDEPDFPEVDEYYPFAPEPW